MKQKTLKSICSFSSVGIHDGQFSYIVVTPAKVDDGIRFYRNDLNCEVDVSCTANTIGSTSLGHKHCSISTVEHLLAAFAGCGITNAKVFCSTGEIPICDGSSKIFMDEFKKVGIVEQAADYKTLVLTKEIETDDFVLKPALSLILDVTLEMEEPVGHSQLRYVFSTHTFYNEIAQARTFGFAKDKELLLKNNLAYGATKKNTIIIDESFTTTQLRYADEFVRHKILDMIGDFHRRGYSLQFECIIKNPTHTKNDLIMNMIFENQNYVII